MLSQNWLSAEKNRQYADNELQVAVKCAEKNYSKKFYETLFHPDQLRKIQNNSRTFVFTYRVNLHVLEVLCAGRDQITRFRFSSHPHEVHRRLRSLPNHPPLCLRQAG